MAIKYGRDMKPQHQPAPLPRLDDTIPSRVLDMIKLLIRHQEELASDHARTIVIQTAAGGCMSVKVTFDLVV